MATYDPQKGHARPKPASDEPAPVDDLLDVATEESAAPAEPEPSPAVSPIAAPAATPAPAQRGGATGGPAKKVGIGVAVTAVVFALSWALRRKRRNRG